jgi:hypothetical protein
MTLIFRILAVSTAILLCSCALFPNARDRAIRKTPAYQAGYTDGCAAANAEAASFRDKTPRDEAMAKADPAYRGGWNTGFSSCRTMRNPSNGNFNNPIPDPSPGH